MRRVPYDSLLRQASLSYPSAQLKRNAYGGMVGWPHWHVIIWGRLVVNWILEKVFSLLDSVFLSFLRWGKNFPLFGELLLTTTTATVSGISHVTNIHDSVHKIGR